jgi:RNA polymerase sigma factor (sigma-70 family)
LVKRLLPSTNHDPQDRALAWEEWYVGTGKAAVLSFIRSMNGTSEPDMDILQEAMITAYTRVERGLYEPRAGVPFTAYVKGIARNKIREAWRRAQRFVPLDDALGSPLLAQGDGLHLETIVERRERHSFFMAGLSKLLPCRRRVLEGYLQGHSTAEIAQALGISTELVRQHKCRGLRNLRQMAALAVGG